MIDPINWLHFALGAAYGAAWTLMLTFLLKKRFKGDVDRLKEYCDRRFSHHDNQFYLFSDEHSRMNVIFSYKYDKLDAEIDALKDSKKPKGEVNATH